MKKISPVILPTLFSSNVREPLLKEVPMYLMSAQHFFSQIRFI